jgi:hypothetical protein
MSSPRSRFASLLLAVFALFSIALATRPARL